MKRSEQIRAGTDSLSSSSTDARDGPLLLTAGQVAQLLQVSPRSLWRLMSSGKVVPPVRFGGNTRWRLAEVEAWIAEGCPPVSGSNNVRRR